MDALGGEIGKMADRWWVLFSKFLWLKYGLSQLWAPWEGRLARWPTAGGCLAELSAQRLRLSATLAMLF